VTLVPFPDPYRPILQAHQDGDAGDAVADYIEEVLFRRVLSPDDVAAILLEPIQGEGGYIIPAPNFFKRLRDICDRYGILLIVDEIQSGVGRTGRWWAVEHESIKPDIICFAKGIASGLPIGGIIANKEVMDWEPGSHATTFGGNPIAAAAGLATLNVIEEENLLHQAEIKGQYILTWLNEIQKKHETIGNIRGRGLMIGFEFVNDKETKETFSEMRNKVVQDAFEAGLLLLPCGPSSIRITPPLNITQEHLDEGLEILERVLDALGSR
jgi:4-aminobutyrate aminotransferase